MMNLPVLDKGHVCYVDHMGNDLSVVQAARVSYGKGSKGAEKDRKLINYLLTHGHTSPFEMIELKVHIKAPLFVARQIVRHRTASWNEISARYTEVPDEFYVPASLHRQSKENKQGRSPFRMMNSEYLLGAIETNGKACYAVYCSLLDAGVTREQARMVLPLNIYTDWYWKMDGNNLLKFFRERLHKDSQWETRQYARAVAGIFKCLYPWTWDAFLATLGQEIASEISNP